MIGRFLISVHLTDETNFELASLGSKKTGWSQKEVKITSIHWWLRRLSLNIVLNRSASRSHIFSHGRRISNSHLHLISRNIDTHLKYDQNLPAK